jgi:multidrug efflux pump
MIGVTLFGLIFTPVFYVVIRRLTGRTLAARGKPEPVTLAQAAE